MAGDPARAQAVLAAPLRLNPDDPAMLSFAGLAHRGLGDTLGALRLLERAVALAPDLTPTRLALAQTMIDAHRPRPALAMLDALPDAAQDSPAALLARAAALGEVGDQPGEVAALRRLAAIDPDNSIVNLRLGHALRAMGDSKAALGQYRSILADHPTHGAAWWSIANLVPSRFDAADHATMRDALASPTLKDEDRIRIGFALARFEEGGGDDEIAFSLYEEANLNRHRQSRFDPDKYEQRLTASSNLYTKGFFARRTGHGCASAAPVFIIGMHRSGSTLIEQMLASHPDIEGTSELPHINQLVRELTRDARMANRSIEQHIASLDAAAARSLGEDYLARAAAHRHGDQPMFLDKMPSNWAHSAFIRLILPKARIIDVRRHPMACGFSNFRQLYASGMEESYSLADWARYYRAYLGFIDHVEAAVPGTILRVIYERLIDDPERELRRICHYLDIAFDPAMLDFHANARTVRTISAEQVRRPINRDVISEWRRFEAWLTPLRDALGDAAERWDDHQQERT